MKRSTLGLTMRSSILGVLLLTLSMLSLSTTSPAQIGIGISVRIAPPALPVYAQPICPGPGYLWTPGYWAWSDDGGYYWVPGTWVIAPVGMLWTPGYWGFAGGVYGWHAGYWGPHVGFYGGINYGFGYGGVGFFGGEWRGGAFFYNRAVMNINVTNIHNVYNRTVVVNNTHAAFNGPGGIVARPTAREEAYAHESHIAAVAVQRDHERAASQNREMFASANHGRPAIAATGRPGEFSGHDIVRAHAAGGEYHAANMPSREARAQGGNHGEAARNSGRTDRPAARAENNERNSMNRANENNGEAKNNSARNNARSEAGNHEQKAAHETSRPSKPEKQSKPAKAESKHEGRR